jgi:hypothetical protein
MLESMLQRCLGCIRAWYTTALFICDSEADAASFKNLCKGHVHLPWLLSCVVIGTGRQLPVVRGHGPPGPVTSNSCRPGAPRQHLRRGGRAARARRLPSSIMQEVFTMPVLLNVGSLFNYDATGRVFEMTRKGYQLSL